MQTTMFKKGSISTIALLWLLVLAVLTSQWLGFAHRMSHMSTNSGVVLAIAFDDSGEFELRKLSEGEAAIHSCLLADACSIVDALQHAVSWNFLTVHLPKTIEAIASSSWSSILRVVFLSRAPPN